MPAFFNGVSIKKCSCSHEYQDGKYGNKMRVHSVGAKGDSFSCTVCGDKKSK